MSVNNYFTSANTAQGKVDFTEFNLKGIENLYVVNSECPKAKAYFFITEYKNLFKPQMDIEIIKDSLSSDIITGLIFPKQKTAIIDNKYFKDFNDKNFKNIEIINLDTAVSFTKNPKVQEKIDGVKKRIQDNLNDAYSMFSAGLKVHDEWEKIYIANMDFEKADELAKSTAENIIKQSKFNKQAVIKHRYFGVSTHKGPINYIENLTMDIKKRYLIKGRPGTGKSTLLKKLVKAAEDKGIDSVVYHCAFDSNSLDMVVLPELSVCIFDSTAPHVIEPSKPDDEILDMYAICVKENTDETYKAELDDIQSRYTSYVSQGIECLSLAKQCKDEYDAFYSNSINYNLIHNIIKIHRIYFS